MSKPRTEQFQLADRLHLLPRHRDTLTALLHEHLPGIEVWAYGSRVNGQSHDGSDLDLVLRSPDLQEIPVSRVADLKKALRESNIPFLVEARDWARLPESFHREIEREYAVLVEKEDGNTAGKRQEVALGELVEIYDGPHATPKKTDAGPIFLGISNLASGRLDLGKTEHLSEEDYKRWTQRVTPEPGDTVFSYETRLGEAAHIPTGLRCCLGRRMGLLRPKDGRIDARFLLYAFLGERFQEVLRSRTIHGSTVNRIPLTEMGSFPIAIPTDLSEQRAIAHILGTLDDKIELNRRMNETLESMAQALFQSWFVDFDPVRARMEGRDTGLPKPIANLFPDRMVESELGLIPDGWEILPLSQLIEINPTRSLPKGDVAPYLDMANMPTKGHVPHAVVDRECGSGMRFTNGDTLLARITPCLENGKTAYVDFLQHGEIGWGSTEYIVMRSMPPLPDEFAYYLARSRRFREFAIQNMTGTSGRQRVPAATLSKFLLPAPPNSVAESFGKFVRPLTIRAGETELESRTLAALRNTLLPRLVSDKLRIKGRVIAP